VRKYRYKAKKLKKYRRRKHSKKFFGFGFLSGVILASGFYFLFFSPVFQVKEIKISGNANIPIEELKSAIFEQIDKKIIFFNSKSIFLADLESIKETVLEKMPQVAMVTVERKFPSVLAAQIEERKPVAVFCAENEQSENCFFIDKEGVIFEPVKNNLSNKTMLKIKKSEQDILELRKQVVNREEMESILKINSRIAIPLKELLIISEKRFNVRTSEDWEIYFNPQREIEWQIEKLEIILKEKIPSERRKNLEYIDLRFDKIYIFPKI